MHYTDGSTYEKVTNQEYHQKEFFNTHQQKPFNHGNTFTLQKTMISQFSPLQNHGFVFYFNPHLGFDCAV